MRGSALALLLGFVLPAQAQHRLDQRTDAAALQTADEQFRPASLARLWKAIARCSKWPATDRTRWYSRGGDRRKPRWPASSGLQRAGPADGVAAWEQQDPDLMDRALEEGVDAAAMVGRKDEAFSYANRLVDLRVQRQGLEAGPTQAARLTVPILP